MYRTYSARINKALLFVWAKGKRKINKAFLLSFSKIDYVNNNNNNNNNSNNNNNNNHFAEGRGANSYRFYIKLLIENKLIICALGIYISQGTNYEFIFN